MTESDLPPGAPRPLRPSLPERPPTIDGRSGSAGGASPARPAAGDGTGASAGGETAPPAPIPAPPGRPAAGIDLVRLWTGAVAAVAAYALTLLLTLIAVVLALVSTAGAARTSITASSAVSAVDPWSLLLPLGAQLVAMAHLGSLTATVAGAFPFLGTIDGSASLFAVPLGITLVTALLVLAASALAERRRPSGTRLQAAAQAAVTGLVLTLLVNVVALVASLGFPAVSGFRIGGVHAAGVWPVLVAALLGTAAAWVGRRLGARRTWAARTPAPASVPDAAAPADGGTSPVRARGVITVADAARSARALPAVLLTHVGVIAAVTLPALIVLYVVAGEPLAILTLPLTLANLAGYVLVAGHLGPLHQTAHSSQTISRSRSGTNTDELIQVIAGVDALDIPAWVGWCALLLAVVAVVLAGLVLAARRPARDTAGWIVTPLAYAAAGVALTVLLAVTARADVRGLLTADAGLGPSWWFVPIFAAWGLAVEVVARVLAPVLLPLVPAGLRARLAPPPVPATAGGVAGSGIPAADHDPATGGAVPAGVASRAPLSPRAKRRAILIGSIAGALILVVIAGAITAGVIRGGNGPDKRVGAYLQALVDGDAEKALTLAGSDIASDQRALLTNDVYRAATDRIDGYTIIGTDVAGDSATVRAELRQGGRTDTRSYTLTKQGADLLDDHWTLAADDTERALISVSGVQKPKPKVNGAEVAVTESAFGDTARAELRVLPGRYTVSLPGGSTYLAAEDATIESTIDHEGLASARLEMTTTPAFTTEVERQVKQKLEACAKSTDVEPAGCPFRAYAYGDTRNVKWTVTDSPSVRISSAGSGSGWRFYAEDSGEATVTFEEDQSYGDQKPRWEKQSDTDSFYLSGKATVDGNTVTVELNDY
ncbi:hypothetical protein GCM10011512_04380 [Tersicoccus solisilvae]|uniref:Uncharacterized protein n=1 Tax=Tersicoccus solisilvae TaxID=1882339 RepID=A0ABQ1NMC9_9MICC|nr:hypothetical protein [Tersicoccus solisilvae]GGC80756.1 hypothetical protein GCM10011512_04380 [Tersicoccus solisilvae]